MKKLFTFMLTALMLIASANIFAYEFTWKGVKYETLNSGYVRIIGVDASYTGNIEIVFGDITYTYNGTSYTKPCGAIASDVTFAGNSRITRVTCTLTSISTIPQACFQNCTNLTTVNLGMVDDVNFRIKAYTFAGCSKLSSVTLPQEMWEIDDYAFSSCTGLASLTFNNVYSISPKAFNNCTNLKAITWNNEHTMYEWGSASYLNENSLTSVMPFYKSLGNIVTTANVNTSATSCIFYGMTALRSLNFGSDVKSVGYSAFANCTALTTWSGGANIITYNDKAFYGCTSLIKPISMTAENTYRSYGIGQRAFANTKVSKLTVGTDDTEANYSLSLYEYAFENCSSMTEITLHTGLSSSTDNPTTAFSGCTGVKTLYWGSDYYYFTDVSAFRYNGGFITKLTNLETLTINRKDQIFEHEFYNLKKLKEVTIGSRVKYVSKNAFLGCTALKTVYWSVPDNKNDYNSTSESPFASSDLTTFVIGGGVTHIPAYLLAGQTQLTNLHAMGNATEILPPGVKTIGIGAFYGVPITSLTLPSGIESIGALAFSGCRLTTITIPESLTSIGEQAFVTNSGPLTVTWKARRCAFNNSYKIDGWGVFYPGSGNQSISRITFGSGVEALPARLCFNAMQLTSVTLPESLQSIGDSAFNSCTNLIYIKSNAVVPPTLEGTHVFKGVNSPDPRGLEVVTLEVPANSLALYKSAEGWCEFYGTCGGDEAVDEVQGDMVQCTKVIENGQLYILRDGKVFNLQGAQVK